MPLSPLPPPVKFYLLISLLPPTAEVNYNCGSILSKIYSTKRHLKEDNHSDSIYTLLIKEQWVNLLKVSRISLFEENTLPTLPFLFLLFLCPKSKELQLGLAREKMSKHMDGNYSDFFVSSPRFTFDSPYAHAEFLIRDPRMGLWAV